MRNLIIGTLATFAMTSPALAWTDVSEGDKCAFAQTFEGPGNTFVMVTQDKQDFDNDDVFIGVTNQQWSLASGDNVGEIKLENEDGDWLSNEGIALEKGFLLVTNYEYANNLFGDVALGMTISRDGKEIDNLSLSGAFMAWMDFERCRRPWVEAKKAAEREQMLNEKYKNDPFAD